MLIKGAKNVIEPARKYVLSIKTENKTFARMNKVILAETDQNTCFFKVSSFLLNQPPWISKNVVEIKSNTPLQVE